MKAFHIVNLLIIVLLLIGICVSEELVVSSSLSDIQDRCLYIEQIVEQDETLKTVDLVLAVDNLEDKWDKYESKLCFLVHHKNIQEIGLEIAKIKQYISNDDVGEFRVCVESIKMYCRGYLHFMGANLHNVL